MEGRLRLVGVVKTVVNYRGSAFKLYTLITAVRRDLQVTAGNALAPLCQWKKIFMLSASLRLCDLKVKLRAPGVAEL